MAGEVVRKAKLELLYRGVDLGGYCTGFEYTDNAHGTIDELRVTLEDRERRWQGGWMPKKSEEISASIQCFDWFKPGENRRLDCGKFTIDELRLTGPPNVVELTAVSSRVNRSARIQKKCKGHEEKTLSEIAAEVAASAGLKLVWQASDQFYFRVDQKDESDLAFLKRLALDEGNSIKIVDQKLLVYEGKKYDDHGPHGNLVEGTEWIKVYSFNSKSHDLYRACVVTYWHPDLKKELESEFAPPGAPQTGEVLRINTQVKDIAEAHKKAISALRRKNREETTAEITCVGDPRRRATQTLMVGGFGFYDGKYYIDQVLHSLDDDGAYDTIITLRKVLDY
jgi:phage protein D